jgi:hypothetical protein
MKKFLTAVLFASKSKANAVFALMILTLAVLGCSGGGSGGNKNSKPVTAAYHGGWASSDGASLQITADGLGYYRNAGTTVNGAAVELDDTGKVLKLSFLGVSVKEFQINQEPSNGTMKLDGVVYKRLGDGEGTPTPKTSGHSDDPDMPSESERDALVSGTMEDFAGAVEKGDFTEFRSDNCSNAFKTSISAGRFNELFGTFIKQKKGLLPILRSTADMTPDYSPEPNITDDDDVKLLNLNGSYNTTQKTNFELKYVKEGGDWKIFGIKIRVEPVAVK